MGPTWAGRISSLKSTQRSKRQTAQRARRLPNPCTADRYRYSSRRTSPQSLYIDCLNRSILHAHLLRGVANIGKLIYLLFRVPIAGHGSADPPRVVGDPAI